VPTRTAGTPSRTPAYQRHPTKLDLAPDDEADRRVVAVLRHLQDGSGRRVRVGR
jgi:hypothetical protein